MPLETIFKIANLTAVLGWVALAFAPVIPRIATRVAGRVIPLLFAVAYVALLVAFWGRGKGGFDTLANVMLLFTSPEVALAGWIHYLAFDLFVGAWEVRTAEAEGIPHVAVIPCLALTFIFGPAGFLAFSILRAARSSPANAISS